MKFALIPTLDDLLAHTREHATACRVAHDCGANPIAWPADVRLALDLDQQELGREFDGIAVRSIQHACVPHAGVWWCVRRIRFDVVRGDRIAQPAAIGAGRCPAAATPGAADGAGRVKPPRDGAVRLQLLAGGAA